MCTAPLPARKVNGQMEFLGRSDKERFFFGRERLGRVFQIPCGQCTECRLKRSREWAIRCVHEASLHRDNCFLTLTYDDDGARSAPGHEVSLQYKDYSAFMKRLRSRYPRDKFGFFACGEYGETNPVTHAIDGGLYRAHFHAILFGFNFPDRIPCRMLGRADLFKSAILDSVWGHGACKIGEVSFESAAYVARYAMKKVNGARAMWHYMTVTEDGEIVFREPELLQMSKRPAIGKKWFEKFGAASYDRDAVVARGVEMQPPRYYDKLLPDVVRQMVGVEREKKGSVHNADHTDVRNNDREIVVKAGLREFKRD